MIRFLASIKDGKIIPTVVANHDIELVNSMKYARLSDMGLLDIEPLDDKLAMLFVTQSGKKAVENYVQPSNTEKEEADRSMVQSG